MPKDDEIRHIPIGKPSPGPELDWVQEIFGKPMRPERPLGIIKSRRTIARKGAADFEISLRHFFGRLGTVSPYEIIPILLGGGASERELMNVEVAGWAQFLYYSLSTSRYALIRAYSDVYEDRLMLYSTTFIMGCWYDLAVLSLQGSWDKLAQIIRSGRGIATWPREGKTPTDATEQNTNLYKVIQYVRNREDKSAAEMMLIDFWESPGRKSLNKIANGIKHGRRIAWEGLAKIPTVNVVNTKVDQEGRKRPTSMTFGYAEQKEIYTALEEAAEVYKSFIPVAEEVAKEYLAAWLKDL